MLSLPHKNVQDGRKRFSVRRIGWLPSLEKKDLPFDDKYMETDECVHLPVVNQTL